MKNLTRVPTLNLSVSAAGFTLIEVMIAAAMGMVLLFATLSIFDRTNSAKMKLSRTNEIFQTGVFALNTLQTDLKLAGFYGQGIVPSTVPASAPNPCSTSAADWLAALRVPVQAYDAADVGSLSCLSGVTLVPDSSIVVIRRASTCTVGSANCSTGSSGTPMVQVSQCNGDAVKAQTAISTASLTLKATSCSAAAPIRQFYTRIYYLDQNNVSSDGIATLKRLDLENGGFVRVTVAQGVQQMRLVYGIDHTGSGGIVDSWNSEPTWASWPNIVQVKVNLLMRGTDPDNSYINAKAYRVGDLEVDATNDHFYRNLVSATVALPNVLASR